MVEILLSLIPLAGTTIGSVLGVLNCFNNKLKKSEDFLVAVATGILGSISLSLLLEAINIPKDLRNVSCLVLGILIGFLFIFIMDKTAKQLVATRHKLFTAMLIHNIPEGILVGISLANAGLLKSITIIASISIQNIPDGLVVSMPLVSVKGKNKALLYGILSGVVEPIAAIAIMYLAINSTNIKVIETFLIGISISTIIMITIDLLKECESKKTAIIAAIITTIFNFVLS